MENYLAHSWLGFLVLVGSLLCIGEAHGAFAFEEGHGSLGGGVLRLGGSSGGYVSGAYGVGVSDWFSLEAQGRLLPDFADEVVGGLSLDVRAHWDRYSRWDPYLLLGLGVLAGHDALANGDSVMGVARLGVGCFWHLSKHWSLRVAGMYEAGHVGHDGQGRSLEVGVVYWFGETDASTLDVTPLGGKVWPLQVHFSEGLAIIAPRDYEVLDGGVAEVMGWLQRSEAPRIAVVCHAPDAKLAEARATQVMSYCIDSGVPVDKLVAVGKAGAEAMELRATSAQE